MLLYQSTIINVTHAHDMNLSKNVNKNPIYQFWVICDLMVNYMEIQDFVTLPYNALLRYTWNDTESVLENCENFLEKVFVKSSIFFLETCTNNQKRYWPGTNVITCGVVISPSLQCHHSHYVPFPLYSPSGRHENTGCHQIRLFGVNL